MSFYNSVIMTHADAMTAQSARLARGLCRIKHGDDEAGISDLSDTVRWMRGREQVPDKIRAEVLKSLADGSELLSAKGNCTGGLELMGD